MSGSRFVVCSVPSIAFINCDIIVTIYFYGVPHPCKFNCEYFACRRKWTRYISLLVLETYESDVKLCKQLVLFLLLFHGVKLCMHLLIETRKIVIWDVIRLQKDQDRLDHTWSDTLILSVNGTYVFAEFDKDVIYDLRKLSCWKGRWTRDNFVSI